jgi:tRNA (adenine22-N1)-methyltransferase
VNLSQRLKSIEKYIPKGSIVVDVGTDHCYLPIKLINEGIAQRVIATDINKGPLDKAQRNITLWGMGNEIELRLGSGLKPILPREVNTAIIAGMGGETILEILRDGLNVAKTLKTIILQPMTLSDVLRRGLEELSFRIVDEELVTEENFYYEIIIIKQGTMKISKEAHYFLGPILCQKKVPPFRVYLQAKIEELIGIRENLLLAKTPQAKKRLEEIEKRIRIFSEEL